MRSAFGKWLATVVMLVWILVGALLASAEENVFKPFPVYTDANSVDNHFTPSGWMGDFGAIQLDEAFTENPHSGTTCIKIVYTGASTQHQGWAGVYWQDPPNNWGSMPGGYDLTGAKRLTFWARGEMGGERCKFRIGGITGTYADSDRMQLGPITLSRDWQLFTIPLHDADLSSMSGGFCWIMNAVLNPQGGTIYVDDIRYE